MSINRPVTIAFFIGLLSCAAVPGADWITARGDAQRTGSQLNETVLSRSSVAKIRLLWIRRLVGVNRLPSDPLIFGPFVTHRGIKELVIEQDTANNVRAIDADLGTTFWERRLTVESGVLSCSRQPVAPAMSVPPFPVKSKDPKNDDEFSDGNRPIYAFATDETLFALRPSTGQDFFPARRILPPDVHPVETSVIDGVISLSTSPNCQSGVPTRTWTLSGEEFHTKALLSGSSLPAPDNGAEAARFQVDGLPITAQLTPDGALLLVDQSSGLSLFRSSVLDRSKPLGLATARSEDGRRFLLVAFKDRLAAFIVTTASHKVDVHLSWSTDQAHPICAPVLANGLVYVITSQADSTQPDLQLRALDFLTGVNLYTSGPLAKENGRSTNLAIANGHLVFATAGMLYCFGLPVDL